jgi:pantothenate kinase
MAEKGRPIALDDLADMLRQRSASGRTLTAIVGPPGGGKSTFASKLEARLNHDAQTNAAVLPMDGYHFDDTVLHARGLSATKGAPETFDVGGLHQMILRLKRNQEVEIAVPVFDRELEIARAAARLIPRSINTLIVEGNYLLLDRPPWSDLHTLFDITVMVTVPEEILRQRLTERWRNLGFSPSEISAKVEANDLPNGRVVLSASVEAEYVATL